MSSLDILILGAGPAGFSVGRLLSKKGYSVEIFDAAFFPRSKICGEFLNPQAISWLKQQNLLPPLLQLDPYPILGMKISDMKGNSFTGHYRSPDSITGFAVMRKEMDTLLVNHLSEDGIVIHQGYRAERLIFENGHATGVTGKDDEGRPFERKARVLIGADGRNNLIGRSFGWMKGIPTLRKHAFSTYFQSLPGTSNFGEIHMIKNGYLGIAPLSPELSNIAVVLDESACPGGSVDLDQFLRNQIQESPLQNRFAGAKPCGPVVTIGPLGFQMKRTSGYGTLLVGDTCGFIDPFTGEGMNYAFLSAELASEVLEKAFQTNNFSDTMLTQYDLRRRAVFGRKYRLSRLLQKAIEWPELARFLVHRFAGSPDLADAMVSAVGSAAPIENVWNLGFLLRVALGSKTA